MSDELQGRLTKKKGGKNFSYSQTWGCSLDLLLPQDKKILRIYLELYENVNSVAKSAL